MIVANQKLPESVQEIADVIGVEDTLKIVGSLSQSGSRSCRRFLYVPAVFKPDWPLIQLLGYSTALKFQKYFAGSVLEVATCAFLIREHRNKNIVLLFKQGIMPDDLANHFLLSKDRIYKIIQKNRKAND